MPGVARFFKHEVSLAGKKTAVQAKAGFVKEKFYSIRL